jgi:PAS domain S-box-containing protein
LEKADGPVSSSVPTLLATYQLRQREFLLRITRAMTSRLDLPSLLELILRSAAEMVGCPAGMILLQPQSAPLDASMRVTPRFQVRAVYGITRESLRAFAPLLDVSTLTALHAAALERSDETVPPTIDLSGKVREVEESLGDVLGQVIALPLLFESEMLGVIYLFRGNYAFTQLDWQFLQGFADQAAIAVRNASLVHLLDTERTRLATILENSADGIMILNADRQVVAINQALTTMVAMPAEDAVGRPCGAVLPLENVDGYHLCQDEAYSSQATPAQAYCEGELAQPGKRRIVTVTYTPLLAEDGRLLNIIVNVHDITRFREEEEMKSTFTSIISHELKTPVALIKGYAQTLARPDASWDQETAHQGLQIIEEEADRLEGLINNLLDVSRIAASGLKLDYDHLDLEQLARKVAEAYRTQTDRHSILLDFPAALPLVWGDEERLRQVLTNLVSNAIKYSPDGGVIRIGGWVQPAHAHTVPIDQAAAAAVKDATPPAQAQGPLTQVVMFVADQGVGIPASELVNIFDRFYRVDSSLRRTTAGAGLGLFLSRAIVEAHGGRIWANSEPGRGSTIFFTLPADQDEPQ